MRRKGPGDEVGENTYQKQLLQCVSLFSKSLSSKFRHNLFGAGMTSAKEELFLMKIVFFGNGKELQVENWYKVSCVNLL